MLELHLNDYNDSKLEYLRAVKKRLTNVLIPAQLLPFSDPCDEEGYDDHPISNDMINEIYAEFSKRSRHEESDKYLRTLNGMSSLLTVLVAVLAELVGDL